MARGARWMWAASSLLRRDGVLPGGSPKRLGSSLRLQGLAFQAAEHARRQAGEEIVMLAGR